MDKKQKQEADALQKAHEQKINEIFEMMNKWDSVSGQVPSLVSRFHSLKALHENTSSFQNSLSNLHSQQEDIKKLLKFNSDLMNQVDGNFKSNLHVIESNVTALEKRFTALASKLEELGMETF